MITTYRVVDTLIVLRVTGQLSADPDAAALDAFRRAVDEATMAAVDLVIDLSRVESLDSEGVGELARALVRLSERGGRFGLIAPSAAVRRVLAVTKLDSVFRILPSEEAAIDVLAFNGTRA